jgi:hypothetical protein
MVISWLALKGEREEEKDRRPKLPSMYIREIERK